MTIQIDRPATRTHLLMAEAARLLTSAQMPDRTECDCGQPTYGLQPFCEAFSAAIERHLARQKRCIDCGEPVDYPSKPCSDCTASANEEAAHRRWVRKYATTSGDA